jgi:hypothetical protein
MVCRRSDKAKKSEFAGSNATGGSLVAVGSAAQDLVYLPLLVLPPLSVRASRAGTRDPRQSGADD